MKSIEQILGFIEGWELAISTNDEALDKNNPVLNTLKNIRAYICFDNPSYIGPKTKEEFTPDNIEDKDFNLTFDWTANDDNKLEVCKAVLACRAREAEGTITHQNFSDAADWLYSLKGRITHLGVNKKFTGLYDKNRKPIFEGDWLKTKTGRICEVNYKSTSCFQGWDLTPVASLKYPNNCINTEASPEWDLWESDNLEIVEKWTTASN